MATTEKVFVSVATINQEVNRSIISFENAPSCGVATGDTIKISHRTTGAFLGDATVLRVIDSKTVHAEGIEAIDFDTSPYGRTAVVVRVFDEYVNDAGDNTGPTIAPNTADAFNFGKDATPVFEFTGSDTESNDLVYQIQIDNNADMSSPILDKSSATDPGFVNTVSGGDTSPFTAGNKVSYTVQPGDGLAPGTYYWRARCTDPSGSGTNSSWTAIRSLVVEEDIAPTVVLNTADENDFAADTTPTLEFTGTDSHDDAIVYQVQIDDADDFATPLINAVSDTDDGFVNTVDGDNESPFTSGEKISFTVQAGDELTTGTYYWRVRAKDPSGSNTFGDWTTEREFTVTT